MGIFGGVKDFLANPADETKEAASDAAEQAQDAVENTAENAVQQYKRQNKGDWQQRQQELQNARQAGGVVGTFGAFDTAVKTGWDFATDYPGYSAQNTVKKAAFGKNAKDESKAFNNAVKDISKTYQSGAQYIGKQTEGTAVDNPVTGGVVEAAEFGGTVAEETVNAWSQTTTGVDLKKGKGDAEAGTLAIADTVAAGSGKPLTFAARGATKMGLGSLLKGGVRASDEIANAGRRFFRSGSDDLAETGVRTSDTGVSSTSANTRLASEIENTKNNLQQYMRGGPSPNVGSRFDELSSTGLRTSDDVTPGGARTIDDATGSQTLDNTATKADNTIQSGIEDLKTSIDEMGTKLRTGTKWGGYTAAGAGGLVGGATLTTLLGGGSGPAPGGTGPGPRGTGPSPDTTSSETMKEERELQGGAILYRVLGETPNTVNGYAVFLWNDGGSLYVLSSAGQPTSSGLSVSDVKNGGYFTARFDAKSSAVSTYREWYEQATKDGGSGGSGDGGDGGDGGSGDGGSGGSDSSGATGWGNVRHASSLVAGWHLFVQKHSSGRKRYLVVGQTANGLIYLSQSGRVVSSPEYFGSLDDVKAALKKYIKRKRNGEVENPPDPSAGAPDASRVQKAVGTGAAGGANKKLLMSIGAILVLYYLYNR